MEGWRGTTYIDQSVRSRWRGIQTRNICGHRAQHHPSLDPLSPAFFLSVSKIERMGYWPSKVKGRKTTQTRWRNVVCTRQEKFSAMESERGCRIVSSGQSQGPRYIRTRRMYILAWVGPKFATSTSDIAQLQKGTLGGRAI